ncbi:lysophospholipase [Rhexocercosporidium sp. MPI-PUGE-AT-0058]|nr:lysophospholipase [Rhexocercosporidium sp. MPI-PUGE-AT-0058]
MHSSTFLAFATLIASTVSTYAPISTSCPQTPLVRTTAGGLSDSEENYRVSRKVNADIALALWLMKTDPLFLASFSRDMPTIALTSSGGGFRATLSGAGTVQALDIRDTYVSTSGLYQAISYHSGLSGGSWLLSSIISNNYATISTLFNSIWKTSLSNGLFNPLGNQAAVYQTINNDLLLKQAQGFPGTIADAWSRLISYAILPGANGGVDNLLSQVTTKWSFKSFSVPYPIILAQHVDLSGTSCLPPADAPFWEFTPFETGSWDSRIAAFTPTKYLGTSLSAGAPTGQCTTAYENLGFIAGTSSTLFQDPGIGFDVAEPLISNFCQLTETVNVSATAAATNAAVGALPAGIPAIQFTQVSDLFASWPNPFYKLASAPLVQAQQKLSMVDGGESGQINPIFPMLLPQRNISVIIVSDNTDGNKNYPSGKEMHATYLAAQTAGLTRMPFVPESSVLLAAGLTSRPVFFGCGDSSKATIVWMPNFSATPAGGNVDTSQMQFTPAASAQVIANGAAVMSQNNSSAWAKCLGCAIMDGAKNLPPACTACFTKYCFKA